MNSQESSVEMLMAQLEQTYGLIQDELLAVYEIQDWRPERDEWSFRYIAGHMAQVELDCYLNRAWRIAAGENPHYLYYSNAGWDFSHYDMKEWLFLWNGRRQELLEFVGTLTEEQLSLTGTHEHFGIMTINDVLKIALDHDREHLVHLQALREVCGEPVVEETS